MRRFQKVDLGSHVTACETRNPELNPQKTRIELEIRGEFVA